MEDIRKLAREAGLPAPSDEIMNDELRRLELKIAALEGFKDGMIKALELKGK